MIASTPRRKPAPGGELAALMAEMGSAKGFDPIPPDQYRYFLGKKESPLQRLLALVRSLTLSKGRRSPYCVDEHGRELRLAQLQKLLEMEHGNFNRAVREAKERGLIRVGGRDEASHRAHPHRVYLCGNVKESVGYDWGEEKEGVCTDPYSLSPSDRKIVAGWPKEQQERFYAEWNPVVNRQKDLAAEAIAQIRAKTESLLDEVRSRHALPVRRIAKRRQPKQHLVQLNFLDEGFVQTPSVQTLSPGSVHRRKAGSAQTSASLLSLEKEESPRPPSSSTSTDTEFIAERLQIDDDVAKKLLLKTREAEPSLTAREVVHLGARKLHQLRGARVQNLAGLLLTSVPKMAMGAMLTAARQTAADEIARERANAEETLAIKSWPGDSAAAIKQIEELHAKAHALIARLDAEAHAAKNKTKEHSA